MTEALNLVPLGGVSLRLARVSARAVARMVRRRSQPLRGWIDHVAATQARAFVAALASRKFAPRDQTRRLRRGARERHQRVARASVA